MMRMDETQFLVAGFWLGIIFFSYIYFFVECLFQELREKQFKRFLNERKLQQEYYVWKQSQKGFWRKIFWRKLI
jgi:hypothetical protein